MAKTLKRRPDPRAALSALAPARNGYPAGRGMGAPQFEGRPPLPLREVPPAPAQEAVFVNEHNTYLRVYALGACSVIVTRETGRWHLSIARPDRYPDWDEIVEAWYRCVPDSGVAFGALVLPPKREYLNFGRNVFQVKQIPDPDLAGSEAAR